MKKIFFAACLMLPVLASAHGTSVQMVAESTKAALGKFETEETAAATSFSGVKGWLDGSDAKIRVYFNNNADSLYYTCTMHHGSNGEEHLTCSKD